MAGFLLGPARNQEGRLERPKVAGPVLILGLRGGVLIFSSLLSQIV